MSRGLGDVYKRQITQDILKEESEEYLMKDQSQGQGFGRQKEMVKHPEPSNSQKQLPQGLKPQGGGEVLLLEPYKSVAMVEGLLDRRESGK